MKKRIERIYKEVLAELPAKYHRPAKFFKSEKKMLEYVGPKMYMTWRAAKKFFYGETSKEEYIKAESFVPSKYHLKVTNSIAGLAFEDEIALNCYALNKESDKVIRYVILHELGHSNDKKNRSLESRERFADKFALSWI